MGVFTRQVKGFVGGFNTFDWYSFTLDSSSVVNLELSTGSARVLLYRSDGTTQVDTASSTATSEGWLNRLVAAGTYYVAVSSNTDQRYSLTLSAGTPTVGTSQSNYAGQSQAGARNLGTLGATPTVISEWVGPGNPDDWYAFTVTQPLVQVTLSGLSSNASIVLRNASGQVVDTKYGGSTSNASMYEAIPVLAVGTYYLQVSGSSTVATGYNLQLSSPPVSRQGGATIGAAKDLGVLGGTPTVISGDGNGIVTGDYYSFRVSGRSTLSLNLSGLTGNATVRLYDGAGGILASKSGTATGDATLT